jgi:hypothetical protein
MNVERHDKNVHIILSLDEVRLMRRALERASFIDTPVGEQAAIATFCARALEALPLPPPSQ